MRSVGRGGLEEVTPAAANVRTLVHEYGGGEYRVLGGEVFWVELGSPGIRRLGSRGVSTLRGSQGGPRYADFARSPDGRFLLAVEEEHAGSGAEATNRLVCFDLAESGGRHLLAEGHDFFASPCFAPDGSRLAWLSWDHPDMPWDATTLWVAPWGPAGAGVPRAAAGGGEESVFQPDFSPEGRLTFVSDRTGWWNLHGERDGGVAALCPREEEFGLPQWVFGLRTWGFLGEDAILCVHARDGRWQLARLELSRGALDDLTLPYSEFLGLRTDGRRATFVAASPSSPAVVCSLDLASGRVRELRRSTELALPSDRLSTPQAISFASEDGRNAHAFLYAPAGGAIRAPEGERPPLLVKSHGGPTSATGAALQLRIQYWTTRGFMVIDVNYGGSSGYGRSYRNLLRGRWGDVDVGDCTRAALFAAEQAGADVARLAISGGSAGGYTTLCALTFRDVFAAGASYYGIGDLEALARDTHKFESRYLDRLVGPWPERSDLYRARSPIHHTEQLSCPVVFFQGLEDKVVPPNQAEAMVAALASRGITHGYLAFEGEQHGFRRAESIVASLEGELSFYSKVIGFPTEVPPHLEIRDTLPAGSAQPGPGGRS